MIQRVQSIFLFLVSVAMISVLFLPIWFKQGATQTAELDAYKMIISGTQAEAAASNGGTMVSNAVYIAVLAGVSALVALYSIFQFRNRLTQIKLGALNSLLIGFALVAAWYFSNTGNKLVEGEQTGEYLSGFYMPVVALLCNLLANRFIRRDEKLVRDSNRLR